MCKNFHTYQRFFVYPFIPLNDLLIITVFTLLNNLATFFQYRFTNHF